MLCNKSLFQTNTATDCPLDQSRDAPGVNTHLLLPLFEEGGKRKTEVHFIYRRIDFAKVFFRCCFSESSGSSEYLALFLFDAKWLANNLCHGISDFCKSVRSSDLSSCLLPQHCLCKLSDLFNFCFGVLF